MRIGQMNQGNYMNFLKMFQGLGRGQRQSNAATFLNGNKNPVQNMMSAEQLSKQNSAMGRKMAKDVVVPDDVAKAVLEVAYKDWERGETDGEEFSVIARKYVGAVRGCVSTPEEVARAHAIGNLYNNEMKRLYEQSNNRTGSEYLAEQSNNKNSLDRKV